jgi:hypothetical protein
MFTEGALMKALISVIASAFVLMSAPAFAASHAGGKMDDKKVDCSKAENAKDKACAKK